MSPEEKIEAVIRCLRVHLDDDGCVTLDDHLGDVADTYGSILGLLTDGKEGNGYGVYVGDGETKGWDDENN